MRRPSLLIAALAALGGLLPGVAIGASPVVAADVSLVIDGHGNGHGVGLSQWGAYGYAVDHGWTAAQILDRYYGGTVAATVPLDTSIRVRLQNLDGQQTSVAVDSGSLLVQGLAGGPWRSVLVRETTAQNGYTVWARPDVVRCPSGAGDPVAAGWTLVKAGVAGPVEVRTAADSSTVTDRAQLLSTCEPSGTVRWYRGTIRALNDAAGVNRTVNVLPLEQYLRTVIAMEMSPGWADDGGGRGAQALQAQAVAARSYALAYPTTIKASTAAWSDVCDMVCQSYFGVAYRTAGSATPRVVEATATDAAVTATAGVVRRVGTTSGPVALTMFSASNGGWTATNPHPLTPFPAVQDDGDDTAANPNHSWSVSLSGSAIAAKYPEIGTFVGLTVTSRNGFGEWGGRVLTMTITGTAGTASTTGATFRSRMGLKDTWFAVRGASSPPPGDACGDRVPPAVTGALEPRPAALYASASPARRIVDTRTGVGTAPARLAAGCTMVIDPNLATDITSLALNVTTVKPGTAGSVTAYACGTPRPAGPFAPAVVGRAVGTGMVVPLSADGRFCVHSTATTDVVIDLVGFHSAARGSKFQPVTPGRLFDSRTRGAMVPAGSVLRVQVAGTSRVPVGATGAALTVQSLSAQASASVVVYPCTATRPPVSSMEVTKGVAVANQVRTALTSTGVACLWVPQAMHVVVDVSGWYGAAATTRYVATSPVRVVDTRTDLGLVDGFTAGANRAVALAGGNGVPASTTVKAVVAQVAATGAGGVGWLTVHPCLSPVPSVSMVRYAPGTTAATTVAGIDDARGRWCVAASAAVHVVIDVSGWYV